MKKLIWKIRYSLHMHKRSKCGLAHGWYNASIAVDENGDDWMDEHPCDQADEEMSCWGE